MAVIVYPNTFAPNTLASAAEVNANFNAITAQVNGNLEAANLAADAVTTVKIADANVTTAKIADASVTDAKIAPGIDATKIGGGLVSDTEFGYLNGVTSAIQTQLNDIEAGIPPITGAASTIASSDLTASRALVSDASGKVAVSPVTATELGYLDGVVSPIQTQINNKLFNTAGAVYEANLANSAVTPVKTSFFDSNGASAGVYAGRVTSAGAATRLPSGWTVSRVGPGSYRVTHGFGTTAYAVCVTASGLGMGGSIAELRARETTYFEYTIRNTVFSGEDTAADFIVFRY